MGNCCNHTEHTHHHGGHHIPSCDSKCAKPDPCGCPITLLSECVYMSKDICNLGIRKGISLQEALTKMGGSLTDAWNEIIVGLTWDMVTEEFIGLSSVNLSHAPSFNSKDSIINVTYEGVSVPSSYIELQDKTIIIRLDLLEIPNHPQDVVRVTYKYHPNAYQTRDNA